MDTEDQTPKMQKHKQKHNANADNKTAYEKKQLDLKLKNQCLNEDKIHIFHPYTPP